MKPSGALALFAAALLTSAAAAAERDNSSHLRGGGSGGGSSAASVRALGGSGSNDSSDSGDDGANRAPAGSSRDNKKTRSGKKDRQKKGGAGGKRRKSERVVGDDEGGDAAALSTAEPSGGATPKETTDSPKQGGGGGGSPPPGLPFVSVAPCASDAECVAFDWYCDAGAGRCECVALHQQADQKPDCVEGSKGCVCNRCARPCGGQEAKCDPAGGVCTLAEEGGRGQGRGGASTTQAAAAVVATTASGIVADTTATGTIGDNASSVATSGAAATTPTPPATATGVAGGGTTAAGAANSSTASSTTPSGATSTSPKVTGAAASSTASSVEMSTKSPTQTELERNRNVWDENAGWDNYDMVATYRCSGCGDSGPFVVEVRGGAVENYSYVGGTPEKQAPNTPLTIQEIFSFVEFALDAMPHDRVHVRYNEELGYVEDVFVDHEKGEEGASFQVHKVRSREAGAPPPEDSPRDACGETQECEWEEYCCNYSCGMCVPFGHACIMVVCDDGDGNGVVSPTIGVGATALPPPPPEAVTDPPTPPSGPVTILPPPPEVVTVFPPAPWWEDKRGGIDTELEQARLDENTAKWDEFGLEDYNFVFKRSCFCMIEDLGPFDVEVRGGAVASVRRTPRNPPPPQPEIVAVPPPIAIVPTVPAMFGIIQRAIHRKVDAMKAEYHEIYGCPTSVFVDEDFRMMDEEMRFDVEDFAPFIELGDDIAEGGVRVEEEPNDACADDGDCVGHQVTCVGESKRHAPCSCVPLGRNRPPPACGPGDAQVRCFRNTCADYRKVCSSGRCALKTLEV